MVYKFSYSNSVSSRPLICGREDFERLIDSPQVKRICDEVAAEPDHKKKPGNQVSQDNKSKDMALHEAMSQVIRLALKTLI